MKIPTSITRRSRLGFLFFAFCAGCFFAATTVSARTITLSLEFARQQYSILSPYDGGQTSYTVYVLVSSDTPPITYDEVDSAAPNPVFGGSETGYGYSSYGDIGAALNVVTNGFWTLTVNKGDPSEKQYTFTVSVNGLDPTNFPVVQVTMPIDGSPAVSTNSSFTWSGPAAWDELDVVDHNPDYSFYASESLAPATTTWNTAPLPLGTNELEITYKTNATHWFTISTPVDNLSKPFTNWVGGAKLDDFIQSGFVTSTNPATTAGISHKLIAHYAFDNSGSLGQDSSGNGNDMSGPTVWGPTYQFDADAEAGGGAAQFFGTGCLYANGQTLTNLNAVLAGSFTFSTWVKTTVSNGADYNNAFFGATIFWAYNDQGNTNDTIPLSITGSKAAFTTRDHLGNNNTLHSLTSVNDGNYHLITVTRDQASGEKKIYVDGNFETSEIGTMEPLNGNNYRLTIGGWDYCTDSNCTNFYAYNGLLDDLQIYSGVLSPAEVATLYESPGTTIPDLGGNAANGLVAYYDFDEGNVVAPDVSGNGNNIVLSGNFGGDGPATSSDAIAGGGSVSFDGGSYLTAPATLLPVLATNFTISLWLNTTQDNDDPDDYAFTGAGIISADVPGLVNDLVPVALTGGQVAFNTGDTADGYDDTINSYATVNDGSWHHVVVSRNQITGEKDIYIDGVLDTSDFNTTALLNDPVLLTIGAIADAGNPDPSSPDDTGYNGYQGLLDDVQIYNRVLNSDEVSFLYNNPGAMLTTFSPTPYPVDVNLQLTIVRSQDPNWGEYFDADVSFNSVNPAPTTTNSVQSPNNYYSSAQYPSGGYGSSQISGSLGEVLNECTNGFWKIYINEGSPTQQVYSFQVSLSGLDTNLLKAVKVFSPTNGSVNVATNPVFYWTGPSNFTTLTVDLLSGPGASLPVAATNWTSAPALGYGTNRFDVDYTSNNFSGATFTTPLDASSNPVRTWTTTFNLASLSFNNIVVGAPAPLPVLLTNLTRASGNLQFSFKTLAGRPHTVQSRTNLTHGTWINLSNFVGDGSLKQFAFPATNPPVQFFRVLTQ